MSDINVIFPVQTLKLPDTNPARIDGGQNNFYVLFDDTVSQGGRLPRFRLPDNFDSNPRIILQFSPANTQVGTLTFKWSISVMATPMDAVVDWDVDDFDTVNTGTKTLALNQAEGNPKELEIPLANFDSGSGGNAIVIKIDLDVSGTAAQDAELGTITFVYDDGN